MLSRQKSIAGHLARAAVAALAIVAALLLTVRPARAATGARPLTEAISVAGVGRCLEATSLGPLVARWLGSDAIDSRVSIVVFARDEPSPALSFEVRRDGHVIAVRRFDAPPVACADVRRVVAIAIALAIESAVLGAPSTETPAAPPPPSQPRAFVPRPTWSIDGVVVAGVLPEVAFGLQTHVDVDLSERFALAAGTLDTFPLDTPVGSGRANLRLIAAEAAGCWIALRSRLDLRACGGAAVGAVRVEGEAFAPSFSPFLPWVSVMGHIGIRVAIWRWLALEAGVGGFLPVVRPNLEVASMSGAILLSRSFPVGGGAGTLGMTVTFR